MAEKFIEVFREYKKNLEKEIADMLKAKYGKKE